MFGLGVTELLIVLALVLVFFGGGKLPELGSGIGEAIKNFRKGLRDSNVLDVDAKSGGSSSSNQPAAHSQREEGKALDHRLENGGERESLKTREEEKRPVE